MRETRDSTKHHEPTAYGRVVRLLTELGDGFMEPPDGSELYFDFDAVPGDDLSRLVVGSAVCLFEEQGTKESMQLRCSCSADTKVWKRSRL